jgi:hypothetical protein
LHLRFNWRIGIRGRARVGPDPTGDRREGSGPQFGAVSEDRQTSVEEHAMNDAELRRSRPDRHWRVIVTLFLLAGAGAEAGPLPGAVEKAGAERLVPGFPLGAEMREDIVHRVLTHPGVALRTPAHRLAVIRMTLGTATAASGSTRTVATVVLFDHTTGEARRVLFDVPSGELLANRRLPGRPQGSPEEFAEAARIVRRDPELAALLDEGSVLDGGFIVADPGGSTRRMLQLKLLTADRLRLVRSITVDLTLGVIASPGGEPGTSAASRATGTAAGTKGAIR